MFNSGLIIRNFSHEATKEEVKERHEGKMRKER